MISQSKPITSKETYERNLRTARGAILVVAVLSVINVLTVLAKQDYFFYFSASVPFYLALFFAEICGMRSEAFYEEYYGLDEYFFYDPSIFYVAIVVALLLAALYFVFWYMSRKSRGWAMATLIVYSLDMVGHILFAAFVYGFDLSDILVLMFHTLVIYNMVQVVRAWNGMQTAPTQAELMGGAAAAAAGMPYGAGAVPFGPGQTMPETEAAGDVPVEEPSVGGEAPAVCEEAAETPADVPETAAGEDSADAESLPKAD